MTHSDIIKLIAKNPNITLKELSIITGLNILYLKKWFA